MIEEVLEETRSAGRLFGRIQYSFGSVCKRSQGGRIWREHSTALMAAGAIM